MLNEDVKIERSLERNEKYFFSKNKIINLRLNKKKKKNV